MTQSALRLVAVAQGGGRNARLAASVLLALWNGDEYPCDLQLVLFLETSVLVRVITLLVFLHMRGAQIGAVLGDAEMLPVVAKWGEALRRPAGGVQEGGDE